MKALNFSQAADLVHEIMDELKIESRNTIAKRIRIVENVSLKDIITLYRCLPGRKQIFVPGEIGNENITIVFLPADNCSIIIESEPAVDFRWKIKQQSFNWN